jgi:predicted Zn-dependent peptidase
MKRISQLRQRLLILTLFFAAGSAGNGAARNWGDRPTMQTLKNGMHLIVAPRDYNQVLAVHLFIEGGSAQDPAGKAGLINLMQRVSLKGTASRSAEQIAEAIESVGGRISVSTSADYTEAYTVTTVGDLSIALDLLADITLRPSFPEEEIEKERALVLSELARREDDQFDYTYDEFIKALYAGHPYGHSVEGDPESVGAIGRDAIVKCHLQRCLPKRMALSVCGNVGADKLARAVEKAFQGFPEPDARGVLHVSKSIRPHFKDIVLAKDCSQAFVIAGYPGVPYGHDDYPALRVANAMLGEGMSARLFRRLRDDQSLAYSVGSALVSRRLDGHLLMWIGTSPLMAGRAKAGLLEEARELAKGATREEYQRAQNYVIGKHLIARQSNSAKARNLGVCAIMGVGIDYDERLPGLIKNVPKDYALNALDKYLTSPVSVTLMPKEKK